MTSALLTTAGYMPGSFTSAIEEGKILTFAKSAFSERPLIQYWSNQLRLAQRLGDQLGLRDHFGIIATGYKAGSPSSAAASTR